MDGNICHKQLHYEIFITEAQINYFQVYQNKIFIISARC